MKTFSVITTFNKSGYDEYGYKCISSYLDFWPDDIKLFVYSEDFSIKENDKLKTIDISKLNELSIFKAKNKDNPALNGIKDGGYTFLYDLVKFSHKSFVMFDAIENLTTDWVIWMDGDTITHSKIDNKFLDIFDESALVIFLERKDLFSETGFLAFNRRHPKILQYVQLAKSLYDATIILNNPYFTKGFTDCHVFDYTREHMSRDQNVFFKSITTNLEDKHPFINSILGNYMDHLKGDRKSKGKSRPVDLKNDQIKKHSYWKNK